MKRYLLGAAVIALAMGAGGLSVQPAVAKEKPGGIAPSLQITGNATFTYHWFKNQEAARNIPGGPDEFGLGSLFAVEDSNLYFNATGRMDNGWTDQTFYDWLLNFTGDTNENKAVTENRLRLKSRLGTLMIGNTQGVENIMARGAYAIPGGTGGFDGNFKCTTIRPTGLLLTTDMVGATKYATKITYVTPRFYGLQAGVSYTPNSEHKGEGSNGEPHNKTSSKTPKVPFDVNNVALGLNYMHDFNDDISLALALTSEFGRTRPPLGGNNLNSKNLATAYQTAPRHHTKSYAIGGALNLYDFEFGVEWIDNGKSQQIKNASKVLAAGAAQGNAAGRVPQTAGGDPVLADGSQVYSPVPTQYTGPLGGFNAGTVFSIAGAYSFGLNKVSLGYYRSKRKFNGAFTKGNVYSVDYDRAIAPGFSVFAEGVFFDLKSHQSSVDFQNALRANDPLFTPGVLKNDGRTLLVGAITKF